MAVESSARQDIKSLILQEIVTSGPVSIAELAQTFGVSTTAMRRHTTDLEVAKKVIATEAQAEAGPGRPAKRYVATGRARAGLADQSSKIALVALQSMRNSLGSSAVKQLAKERARGMFTKHDLNFTSADSVADRTQRVAKVLDQEGYASSVRPAPMSGGIQLCQGNCPIETIAQEFPEFCQAETEVLSEVLGVHVQRLATIAQGAHACTTHIPMETTSSSSDEERKE